MPVLDTAPPLPVLGEVLDFIRLIWEVDHALHRTSKRMERSLGITGPQRLVLRIVGRFPGIAAGQLARILHVHPSTLTGILRRLEQQALVRKRADQRDRRRYLVVLTEKGRLLDVEAPGTIEAAVRRTFGRLDDHKLAAAREVLTSLVASLIATAASLDRRAPGRGS